VPTDTTCYKKAMAEALDDERRVYVHKGTLEDVAKRSRRAAYDTSRVLAKTRFAKAMHHHIVVNGVADGLVRPEVADTLVPIATGERHADITRYLGRLTYLPYMPKLSPRANPELPWQNGRLPVLRPGEEIVDTCFQDDYYTFATGPEAAKRMFRDRVPMGKLKARVDSGKEPDLTIITRKGRLVQADQVGANLAAVDPIDLETARDIDTALLRKTRLGWDALVEEIGTDVGLDVDEMPSLDFTSDEIMILTGLSGAVGRVFEASSY
jgi:hypothetical protein